MTSLRAIALHPLGVLVLTVLGCHALLPFTDYLCRGDLFLTNWVTSGRWDNVAQLYSEAGRPTSGEYFWAFRFLPDITAAFKIIGPVLNLTVGVLAYLIARASRFVTPAEALAIGVVAIAFPASKMNGSFMYAKHDVCLCAFLTAVLLTIHSGSRSGVAHLAARLTAAALFCFAFVTESLLMYYGGFLLLLVWMRQRDAGLPWYRMPWGYFARRIDLFVLPIASWLAKVNVSRPHGHYADYNTLVLTRKSVTALARTLPDILTDPFALVSSWSGSKIGLVAAAAVVLAAVVVAVARHAGRAGETPPESPAPRPGCRPALGLLFFGLLLLVLGTLPFAAVGKTFSTWGEESRYNTLIPIPVGIVLVAVARLLRAAGGPGARQILTPVTALFLGACLSTWAVTWWDNYLSLQAVHVRNQSIMRQVQADPRASACTVYCVADHFTVPRAITDLNNFQWTYLECGPRGRPRSIAFLCHPHARPLTPQEVTAFIQFSTIPYALTSIDPAGPECLIVIRPRQPLDTTTTALRYLYQKHVDPTGVPDLIDRVAEIEVYPAPWTPADLAAANRK